MATTASVRPYKDVYVPALHRRFTKAFGYTLILIYLIAIWMGQWNHFIWSWFPIPTVGLRAGLLCIPALLVFLLRVQQWHFGRRNTHSPLDTFWTHALTLRTLYTVAVYAFSAWIYGEIYIWSQATKNQLTFTNPGKLHERTKLNERPILLRFLFLVLALVQSGMHVWYDYDHVRVSRKPNQMDPRQQLAAKAVPISAQAGIVAFATLVLGLFSWFVLGCRHLVWDMWFSFMKQVISLGKISKPTGIAPGFTLMSIFWSEGTLLLILWRFSNEAFDVFMAQEPLKKEKPITSDSRDADGTLLNGLKSPKSANKITAFWELALITERFPERRKTIYADHDRKKGAMHKQVTAICLHELRELVDRVKRATDPTYKSEGEEKDTAERPVKLVQRISQPIKEAAVIGPVAPPKTKLEQFEFQTRELAKFNSSPKNVDNAWATTGVQKTQERAHQIQAEAGSAWEKYKNILARSPIGWFFRVSLRRTANVVVFSFPYSRQFLISNAIATLTNLTVHSFDEDSWGQYQNEVADIVRVFTAALKAIQGYTQSLRPNWTDLETLALPEEQRRKVSEVEETVAELKDGLQQIMGKFGEYLEGLGMTNAEVREAKELVSKGPEMKMAGGAKGA